MNGQIGSAQSWSSGVYCTYTLTTAAPTKAFLEAVGSAVNDAVVNYWDSAPRTIASAATLLTGWSMYGYGGSSTTAVAENSYTFGTAIPGTGTGAVPTLTSMVQSLRTNSSGRSYRGRMYMPATGAGISGDGHFDNTHCQNMATATAAYLVALGSAISAGPGGGDSVAVVASFTKSLVTPITQVLVDNIPDVQHRREDKLGASFTGVAPVDNPE
jgi:hypothetical protein